MGESISDRVKKAWSTLRGNKDVSTEEALGKTGLDIIKTNILDHRLQDLEELNNFIQNVIEKKDEHDKDTSHYTPEQRLNFMRRSANGINTRIQKIAIPWGTAGEIGWYADLSMAWSTLYTWCLITIDSVERLMAKAAVPQAPKQGNENTPSSRDSWKPPINKDTLISKLDFYFTQVIIQPALQMIAFSWKQRDIVPTKVAIVQNIPSYGSNAPQPYQARIPFKERRDQSG